MNKYINGIINTRGFKEIEGMFNDAILECKNDDVNSDLNATTFKQNTLANRKASKKLADLLSKIKLAGANKVIKKEISYK